MGRELNMQGPHPLLLIAFTFQLPFNFENRAFLYCGGIRKSYPKDFLTNLFVIKSTLCANGIWATERLCQGHTHEASLR
jgi:hypothetical protein